MAGGWQPIDTAPVNEVVDWWIDASDEDDQIGWRKTGYRCNAVEPLCIITEDGCLYWPHENGGWPTHWMPLPAPPEAA